MEHLKPSPGNVDVNASILTSVDETCTIQLVTDLDTNTGDVVLKTPDHSKCILCTSMQYQSSCMK